MSATPPSTWPHVCEPTDEQLKRVRRIAAKTGQTVEQVIAAAISRGTSQQYSSLLAGNGNAYGKRH